MTKRLVIAMTGATGATYCVRLLEELAKLPEWESHLVISSAGVLTAKQELGLSRRGVEALADVVYSPKDIGASIASGSFVVDGMVIAPCSMKTLATVANGLSDNLVARAADVTLKQRRRLVMLVRETPLNLVHLRNMMSVTEMGGIIFPPVPAFYVGLSSLEQMVGHTVGRVMDLFSIEHQGLVDRWQGLGGESAATDNE